MVFGFDCFECCIKIIKRIKRKKDDEIYIDYRYQRPTSCKCSEYRSHVLGTCDICGAWKKY